MISSNDINILKLIVFFQIYITQMKTKFACFCWVYFWYIVF